METDLSGYYTLKKIENIVSMIESGGVGVLPTDTIYGLHCKALNIDAVEKIIRVKGRNKEAGLILLMSNVEMVDRYVSHWPGDSRRMLSRIWPARLTALLPASDKILPVLRPDMIVAVRIPAADELRSIISAVGSPLVSTSANRSGMLPMKRIADIRRTFPGLGFYISARGRSRTGPSTIVDFSGDKARLVRSGAFPYSEEGGRKN
ncbi:MAG: threonylcarbamoyl-AMP synthase [Candidatus Krumholzibacteria bacterium]|nr:threonylcarbamoyl-AMP synthase [Candidatus Krumholzibacteria bacterium]